MNKSYVYKDSTVWVDKIQWGGSSYKTRYWKCPMCFEQIKNGDMVYMLINNQKYFPNVVLHEDCFVEDKKDYIFSEIEKEYQEVKLRENIF